MDYFRDFNFTTERLSATMVEMAGQLNDELAVTSSDLLRPLALNSIYLAAQVYGRQYRRDPDPKYRHGLRALLQALTFFEQRWRVAGRLS